MNDELRKRIGDLAYEVTQNNGTERPFTGEYDQFNEEGIYVDIVSGEALFSSRDKYDAGCGWPSFHHSLKEALTTKTDRSLPFQERTEVRSAQADSHLGHVFTDGPENHGGLRFCINSAALRFIPKERMSEEGYGSYLKEL